MRRRRRRRTALIKSNNPHLAGGEKSKELDRSINIYIYIHIYIYMYIHIYIYISRELGNHMPLCLVGFLKAAAGGTCPKDQQLQKKLSLV